jgi:hypothetical protein
MNISTKHLALKRMQVYIDVLSSLAGHVDWLLRFLVLFVSPAKDLLLRLFVHHLVFNLFALRRLLAGIDHLSIASGVGLEVYQIPRRKVHVRDVSICLGLRLERLLKLLLLRGQMLAHVGQFFIHFLDLLPGQFAWQIAFELSAWQNFTLIRDAAGVEGIIGSLILELSFNLTRIVINLGAQVRLSLRLLAGSRMMVCNLNRFHVRTRGCHVAGGAGGLLVFALVPLQVFIGILGRMRHLRLESLTETADGFCADLMIALLGGLLH